ncbi:MAG: glycoside hydrolase family 130 protein [Bacteroidales bacterium]|nr:glycoside hydrolase family 130 protein [Bacteroidales bacterium]
MQVTVNRADVKFYPDSSRVIARFLYITDEKSANIIRRVMTLSDEEVRIALSQVLRGYSKRHRNISKIFEKHFSRLSHLFEQMDINPDSFDNLRKVLIGSYFTMEYSIESAAFFNPSIVEHPDQTELPPGAKRVIISFRATGEGHISSIVFRSGIIDKDDNLKFAQAGKMLDEAESIQRYVYQKESFISKLHEMQNFNSIISPKAVLEKLGDTFIYSELQTCINKARQTPNLSATKKMFLNKIIWLASSHYEIEFSLDTSISERVIFPIAKTEKSGIEDARFVKFTDDNGEETYYATYTAYDGMSILTKFIETKSFYRFKVMPIHGEIAENKGMALFPRKINGKYAMLCRMDNENNYIAFSDSIHIWRDAKLLQAPIYPWEFIQIGNCGSPIETEEGWLVITHAVGQMREYVLGAILLDLNNPEKVIGRLKSPLMIPNSEEREGYVPNVIYSCGSIVHNNNLIIPYAMSDYASTFAFINMEELLHALKNPE